MEYTHFLKILQLTKHSANVNSLLSFRFLLSAASIGFSATESNHLVNHFANFSSQEQFEQLFVGENPNYVGA